MMSVFEYDPKLVSMVNRITEALYPNPDDRAKATDILSRYGAESWHCEVPRVQLAILKSGGSNLDLLARATDLACTDYRDALVSAEYRRQFKFTPVVNDQRPDGYEEAVKADEQEYRDWLASFA